MCGIRRISGENFFHDANYDSWASNPWNGIYIVLSHGKGTKCFVHDLKTDSKYPFKSVHAAICFGKRLRHGRTLNEHERAEIVQAIREKNGWSVKDLASAIEVSPRTVEAWFSGARAVPKVVVVALNGIL